MRRAILVSLTALTMGATAVPAEAAWRNYVNREIGFSFSAPGDVKIEKVVYQSAAGGMRPATVFQSTEDNIEYKVTVVDFNGAAADEMTAIKEASTMFVDKKTVLSDVEARVDSNYGRKMTVDLPNKGGRAMSGVYFKGGYLVQLHVTVLPANGDYQTPDTGRFVDSVAFLDSRVEPDATEVKLVK